MDKEEVKAEIHREGSGKVPLWCHWYAKETEAKYGEDLEQLKKDFPDDIIMAEFLAGDSKYTDHAYWYGGVDEFGCVWEVTENGVGAQVVKHPLSSIDDVDEYLATQFPDYKNKSRDRFSDARMLRNKFKKSYVVGKLFRLFFERMHFLRGMSNTFLDLYTNYEKLKPLMGELYNFILYMIDGWADVGVDAVFLGDDWGFQTQMMINPEEWRKIFLPWYRDIFSYAKSKGMDAWYHTCGNILPIIPDLIDCGLDVLNPIQATAMNVKDVSGDLKGKLTFHGGLDSQGLLHRGDKEEIASSISLLKEELLSPSGGYIGGPDGTIMPEVTLETIKAMCELYRSVK